MSKNAVIPAGWVKICGFPVERKPVLDEYGQQKYNEDGTPKTRAASKELDMEVRVFTKEMAKKLAAKYKENGQDLDSINIVLGNNSSNDSKIGPWLRKLAEISEKQGYLTTNDFASAATMKLSSGLTPSDSNKVHRAICRILLSQGFHTQKSRGPGSTVIENSVNLDECVDDIFG